MAETTLLLTALVVLFAIAFDFVNGFHDAANSISTLVATKVLSPLRAVLWAASFNFLALFVFDTGVAKTVGSGMVALEYVTLPVIIAGLAGATLFGLVTWWFKMPTSSSHALIGGYTGAAITHHAMQTGWTHGMDVVLWDGWGKTLLFIFLAPLIGFVIGGLLMKASEFVRNRLPENNTDLWFRRLQLVSSAGLSLAHGGNDAQKTAGIIAGALVASGAMDHFAIPTWVLLVSYSVMALGTLCGGWRIVETMGTKLTRLKPIGGFCSSTGAATSILLAIFLKVPISSTHAITGAILGTGTAREPKAVRWKLAGQIVLAWIVTIPGAALIAGLLAWALQKSGVV